MLKNYTEKIAPRTKELNNSPSDITLNMILNYSRSVVAKKIKNKKVLFNLN